MSTQVQQAIKPKPAAGLLDQPVLPKHIRLRRLKPGDCLEQLTRMLHRAFFPLWEMGIPCSCVNQTTEVTRQRVDRGECFVAVCEERIVGTVTLYAPDAASESQHFRDTRVASLRQLGVDPRFQGKGVGSALLHLAERWARLRGYDQLALDTPKRADHLFDYYQRQGFHVVETLQFSGRPYRSLIFAKSLLLPVTRRLRSKRPRGRDCKIEAVAGPARRIPSAQIFIDPLSPKEKR